MTIAPGDKVGIVGRTGAGKTTFLSAIFRSFDEYIGEVKINGKEISGVDLKQLRQSMTIIPQDPQLFEDTLQHNLDPYGKHEPEEIIKMLKDFEMWDKFSSKGGLNFKIDDKNLGQGEKQLLCMVRAMLNRTGLVLLDEATANIDASTEKKIQNAIQVLFKESTILMIAHRLNTIMFCNKILVLDQGSLLEFDELEVLKNDPESHFGGMLKKTEDVQAALG